MNNLFEIIKETKEKQNKIKILEIEYENEINNCRKEIYNSVSQFLIFFKEKIKIISKDNGIKKDYIEVSRYYKTLKKIDNELIKKFNINTEEVFDTYFNFGGLFKIEDFNTERVTFTCKRFCGDFDEYYQHTIPTIWLTDFSFSVDFITFIFNEIKNDLIKKENK